jgi:hypothetical protein
MKRLGIALAGTMLLVSAASAQTAAPADTRAIEECLTAAEKNQKSDSACVGIVADPCIRAGNNSDEQAKKCTARELSVWTAMMKKAIEDVKKGGFAEVTKAAGSSQEAWTKSTATFCPVFDKIEPGMVPGGAAYCRLQATGSRVIMLRKLAAAVNEH